MPSNSSKPHEPIRRIAIVGTGVIGASWAAYYLSRGFDVVATDPAPNAEPNLRKYVDDAWSELAKAGLVTTGAARDRLTFTPNMGKALAEADFVQENAPERPDFKIKLFAEMDEAAPPAAILASSSSGIPMDGAKTSEAVIERAMSFYASIGKKPIRLRKSLPGHAANRLQAALYKEILSLIQRGVLSVADADIAVSYGPGLRWGVMGQSLQWHLGGGAGGIHHFMEHLMPPLEAMMKDLQMPDVTPALKQAIVDGVAKEAGGHSVEQLAQDENEVILGTLALRQKAGRTLP